MGLPPGGSSSPVGGCRFRLGMAACGRASDGNGVEARSGHPDSGPSGGAGVPAIGGCGGVSGNGGGRTSGAGAGCRVVASGGRRPTGPASQAMYGIPARCVHWHAASTPPAAITSANTTAPKSTDLTHQPRYPDAGMIVARARSPVALECSGHSENRRCSYLRSS
jgi:hypothetical protein